MRRIAFVAGMLVALGCSEHPTQSSPGIPASAAVASTACTRSWAAGVSGSWGDANMWTPVGVPGPVDHACIDAAGTYTVTLTHNWSVGALELGGPGVAATLQLSTLILGLFPGELNVVADIHVIAGSQVVIAASASEIWAGSVTNDGSIRILDGCGCPTSGLLAATDFMNNGTLSLSGAATLVTLFSGSFTNNGAISVTAPFSTTLVHQGRDTLRLQSGSISGSQQLLLLGVDTPGDKSVVEWSGGTLGINTRDATSPVLRVYRSDVDLMNTTLTGKLDVIDGAATTTIKGRVGAGVHLRLVPIADHQFDFVRAGPVTNDGTIELADYAVGAGGYNSTLSFSALINRGVVTIPSTQRVKLVLDSLVNEGSLNADGRVRVTRSGSLLRNAGTIASGDTLEMGSGSVFQSESGSVMTGLLLLSNATVQGTGAVGDVVSQSGSIHPGLPLGTLTATSVTMDATSGLTIEVGGTAVGTFDQLAVTGNVSYAGTLTVTSVAPFTGGICGQVVPVITDNSSGARGAFNKIFGLVQGPIQSWRIYNPANLFELVGYTPQATVFVNESSLDVTEGGGSTRYQICLGPTRPTADVVVSLSRALDQIEVGPATMTFPVATWLLPRTVTVTPLNDGVIESLHSDTVLSVVTSGDPAYDGAFVAPLPVVITDDDGSAGAGTGTSPLTRNSGPGGLRPLRGYTVESLARSAWESPRGSKQPPSPTIWRRRSSARSPRSASTPRTVRWLRDVPARGSLIDGILSVAPDRRPDQGSI